MPRVNDFASNCSFSSAVRSLMGVYHFSSPLWFPSANGAGFPNRPTPCDGGCPKGLLTDGPGFPKSPVPLWGGLPNKPVLWLSGFPNNPPLLLKPDGIVVEPKPVFPLEEFKGFPNKPCGGDVGVTVLAPKPVPSVVLPKPPEEELPVEGLLKRPVGGDVDENPPVALEVWNKVEPLKG